MLKIENENTSDLVNQDEELKEVEENETVGKPSTEENQVEESVDTANVLDEKVAKQENNKYWAKLKKERAEKKELAESFEQERQKNLELEEMLYQALNNSSTHYKNNVVNELELAEAKLKIALEEGNASDVAKATVDISRITHALNDANKINYSPQPSPSNYNNQANLAQEYEERLHNWLDDNPDLDENNPEYDKKLTDQVTTFVGKLNQKYKFNKKQNLIGSSSYYSMIDEYVDNLREQLTQPSNSANSAKYFGAVRSRNQAEIPVASKPRSLTESEKKAALAYGITDEQFLKYQKNYEQEMKGK